MFVFGYEVLFRAGVSPWCSPPINDVTLFSLLLGDLTAELSIKPILFLTWIVKIYCLGGVFDSSTIPIIELLSTKISESSLLMNMRPLPFLRVEDPASTPAVIILFSLGRGKWCLYPVASPAFSIKPTFSPVSVVTPSSTKIPPIFFVTALLTSFVTTASL